MASMRALFQRLLFPGIRELIFGGYRSLEEQYTDILNVLGSDSAFEEDFSLAGVGLFVRTPEGIEAAEDQFVPGFPKRYQHDDYTLSIGFTHPMIRDGKYNIWRDRSPELGMSARETRNILVADIFNSGFTTANGPDGKALFASDHPNPRQGTQSNLGPTATPTVASVRSALVQFRRFYDDTGVRRIQVRPRFAAVPPELEYDIREILVSAGRPDTANRADNVIRGKLDVKVWDYLTSSTRWFILADKAQHKVKVYNRERFDVTEFEDEKARINWVQASFAFSYGFSHWMGTLGMNAV